jgi:hypothetical protein
MAHEKADSLEVAKAADVPTAEMFLTLICKGHSLASYSNRVDLLDRGFGF